jgi:hypothetical protein
LALGRENCLTCRFLCLCSRREKMLSSASFCAGDVAAPMTSDEWRIVGRRNQPIATRDLWANCKRFPKSILS